MSTEEKSLRDQLTSAFEEDDRLQEEEQEDETDEVDEGEAEPTDEPTDEPEGEVEEGENPQEGGEPKEEKPPVGKKKAEPAKGVDKTEIAPPINYSPEAREAWKNVPPKVKEQIRQREVEIAQAMENTKAARTTHEQLNKIASGYAPVMAAEGVQDPLQAVQGLFQTVAELRMGTPNQRAAKMAQLINHYGIDISMLDSALAGAPAPQGGQGGIDPNIEHLIQQAVAPLYQQRQQEQQYRQQQTQQQVQSELQEFAQNAEFLNDVRGQMADLIEVASKSNRKMTFKEAYDTACALDPRIRGVMEQRAEHQRLQSAAQKTATKRNTASSIGSRPGIQTGNNAPQSIRGLIEEAWDNAS